MVDPTSDVGEDISEEDAPECSVCNSRIVQLPTHRVVPVVKDGMVTHKHFCSAECRTEYLS